MIYSIGYSNRSLHEFIAELRRRNISQLWDVRSSLRSRNVPFNASQITHWAERAGVFYRPCGEVLGGQSRIALNDPRYVQLLDELVEAGCREPLAIMCAEGDPTLCHRTWDIGASLLVTHGIITRSILRDGREENITETLTRVPVARIPPELRATIHSKLL